MSTVVRSQHLDALEKANQTRLYAADIKRRLRAEELSLFDLIGDERIANLPIGKFVSQLPSVASVKANAALRAAHVSYNRPVGHVSAKSMAIIVSRLPKRHQHG